MTQRLRLEEAVQRLEQIAPLSLAADWDNVGLLVDGPPDHAIRRCLLTIDLTEPVLAEAIDRGVDLIVAYHPPIFKPLHRLTRSHREGRLVLDALAARIAVHSPHTALDAAPGGVNDWLASAFPGATVRCLQPTRTAAPERWVEGTATREECAKLREHLPAGAGWVDLPEPGRFALRCRESALAEVDARVRDVLGEGRSYDVFVLDRRAELDRGQGRLAVLPQPMAIEDLVTVIKRQLGLEKIRCAIAPNHREGQSIRSVALCAGAGGSVLMGADADLYWTGEMRHHDLLAASASGISVVLGEHTNTERGYLKVLEHRLREDWPGVDVIRSSIDRDPVAIL
ncbi:MAG: Nif3-like dinuclear metal center hexameric protein [Planctomycetota bacterium]